MKKATIKFSDIQKNKDLSLSPKDYISTNQRPIAISYEYFCEKGVDEIESPPEYNTHDKCIYKDEIVKVLKPIHYDLQKKDWQYQCFSRTQDQYHFPWGKQMTLLKEEK